jgi:mannose-6-phosphate isomerase-like protein (cupin superfamily)
LDMLNRVGSLFVLLFRNINHQRMNAVRKVKMAGTPKSYLFGGVRMVVHIAGEQAEDQLSLIEAYMPPGGDSGLHVRISEDEAIYLITGELEVTVGSQKTIMLPGESYFIPRSVPHRVRNIGMVEARAMLVDLPGVFSGLVQDAGVPMEGVLQQPARMTEEEIAELCVFAEQYGSLVLVPPYQEGEAVFTGKPPIYKRPLHKREQDTYMFFGVPTVLHLAGIETGNEFSLMESFMGMDGDSGLHSHANEDECVYVLHGEVELLAGDCELVLRAGMSHFISRNVPHRLRSRKGKPARVMHWYTPGTLDPFVRMAGIRIKGPNDVGPVYPSPEQIGPILLLSEEYDFQMLVPPGV